MPDKAARSPASAVARFGAFELDASSGELRKHGRPVRIQQQPYAVLAALVEHPGELVTREHLRRRLWPDDTFVVFDASLNTAIRKVRDVLGDSADEPRYIETVPRRGYRFIAPVERTDIVPVRVATVSRADLATAVVAGNSTDNRSRSFRLRHMAAGAIAMVAIGAVAWRARQPAPPVPASVRFQIAPPEGLSFPNSGSSPLATISPDGRRVVFITEDPAEHVYRFWVHDLESGRTRALGGTENGWMPFWSPDGTRIGFFSNGALRVVAADGSQAVRTIVTTNMVDGASWGRDGQILFADPSGGLSRVRVDDGRITPVTVPDRAHGERRHAWPQVLPDGRHFLYLAQHDTASESAIVVGAFDSPQRTRLLASRTAGVYATDGFLLHLVNGTLMARPFDVARARFVGDDRAIATAVAANETNGRVRFSVSESGALVYSSDPRPQLLQPVWFDREGRQLDAPLAPGAYARLELSSDGRFVAAELMNAEEHEPDIVVTDLRRHATWRATTNAANDESPVWSPDSRRFVYARHDGIMQPAQLVEQTVDEPGEERTILRSAGSKHPLDWSRDGRFILFQVGEGTTRKSDIWVAHASGDGAPYPLLATPHDETVARFSPDGRWIAYVSDESGRPEVYVRPFDRTTRKWLVSNGGGAQPRWRRDGGELIYVSPELQLMSVGIRTADLVAADAPRPLFAIARFAPGPFTETPYTMTPDARRFLIGTLVREARSAPITVVTNWTRAVSPPP